MDRSGEKLIPSEYEIAAFDLAPVLTIEEGIEIVSAYEAVADKLQSQLEQPVEEDSDGGVMNPELVVKRYKLAQRAAALRICSRNIAKLCAPEMAALAVHEFTETK
ncbi:MAG: hypothetical protein QFB87_04800 [Patescibacteria group bacterium]|nr:hypothetical protein [Patescibacteria group bacterium]